MSNKSPPLADLQDDIREGIKILLQRVHAESLGGLPLANDSMQRTEAFGMELVDLLIKHFSTLQFSNPVHAIVLYKSIADLLGNLNGLMLSNLSEQDKQVALFTLRSYIDERDRKAAGGEAPASDPKSFN